MIEILSNVEERPEEERAYAEILNDRCSLVRRDGRLLRLVGSERSASSDGVSPSPSDDLRRRKSPFNKSVRLPRRKTRGTTLNFA